MQEAGAEVAMRQALVILLAPILLAACGGRPAQLSVVDGGVEPPAADLTPATHDAAPPKPDTSLPLGPCATNLECPSGFFCQHDGLCTVSGGVAGVCAQLPVCPDTGAACFGVCGCDGQTYCSSCDAHAAGVSVALAKPCLAATCMGLETLYQAAVKKAKACCPMCATVQCVNKVPSSLHCGCDTFVNELSAEMKAIQAEYTARSCHFTMPACGIKCAPPGPGFFCGEDGLCLEGGD
jgi:hypothetical protein